MRNIIKRFFAPPVFEGDQDKTSLARTMNGILWFFTLAWFFVIVSVPFLDPARIIPTVITLLPLITLCAIGLLELRRGQVIGISRMFPFLLWLASTIIIIFMGGVESPETGSYILGIIFAGMFLGISRFYIYTGLSIASILVIYFLEINKLLPLPLLRLNPISGLFIGSLSVGMASLLVIIVIRNLHEALNGLREKQAELAARNDDLNKLMSSASQNSNIARAEANEVQALLQAQLDESKTIARISESMRGEQDLVTLSQTVLRELCYSLGAIMGAIFVTEGDVLRLTGSYAYTRRKNVSNKFQLGEGVVGQAALEKQPILIANLPQDYVSIAAGMVEYAPRVIMAVPFLIDGKVIGVIELASLKEFTPVQVSLLNKALENISIAFSTAQARTQIDNLLAQTQHQAEELRVREEDLKAVNKEIHAQAENLRASQERLRRQQTELEAANAELEERANILQQQRTILDQQNRELTEAQDELRDTAEDLTLANKYKSEFLANMSHELRTPLNSLLILSRMFANNDDGNLTGEQIESAKIIYNSGNDLLSLINDILDLSKVEAGRMPFHFAPMELGTLAENMRVIFEHVAQEKNLGFEVSLANELPLSIDSDFQRVGQVLKNFLSNAFKFTSEGLVKLNIEPAGDQVVIRVSDTGIGMTPEQQRRVFDAFQQADGSTSRKYGGTGLGLAISRELANRLGGRIELQSELEHGSTFSLFLPIYQKAGAGASINSQIGGSTDQPGVEIDLPGIKVAVENSASISSVSVNDDRNQLKKSDKILLIVEDDENFARVVMAYGRKKDFKCLLAMDGEKGLYLAKTYRPDAILLDLKLPGMSGWEVLDAIKYDPDLRHIPVHILSAAEETMDVYKHGALGFLSKPVSQDGLESVFRKISEFLSRNIRTLLIIEDDSDLRHSVRQLLGGSDVKITESESGNTAIQLLRDQQFDCAIMDLNLPDMTGFELLNRIHQDETINKCPVIVYTGRALTEAENEHLLKYANSVIIKGVKSPERLLDETALFLHRVVADMPEEKQDAIRLLHDHNAVFTGKHILVVDDDMRNAFALSRLLSDKGLKVSLARSGAKAIELLENSNNNIDLVLMDIMMPEMDGYETMQRIRAQQNFANLPILALTAKAMKGDYEKCIQAGANDYLSKPVDVERLFSMLRVWLYR